MALQQADPDQGFDPVSAFMSPLAAALSGLMPGPATAPATGSRYDPATGDFLPSGNYAPPPSPAPQAPARSYTNMQLAAALDPSIAPQSASPMLTAGGAAGAPPASSPFSAGGAAISVPGYDGTFTRSQANDAEGVPSKAEWDSAASAATGAPAQRMAQNAPSPASSVDPTTAAYSALHAEKVAEFERNKSLAMQAAQAGNTDISASYAKAAAEAYKMANDISLLSIKHNEPAADAYSSVTLPNGQIVPFNRHTGEYGTPYGQPTPAPVPPREVTAAERATWQLPATGSFTIVPGEAPKQVAGAGTNTEVKLPPAAIDDLAQRYNAGDNSAVTVLGYASATDNAAVIARATELRQQQGGNAMDQLNNQVGLGGRKQEARTVGALGGRINTFSEEAAQTGELALQASDAVPRGQWVPINAIEQMGEAAASNPALSRLQAANNEFATTYAKAANPSGIPTDEGRRAAFAILNVAKSPEAYEASVRQLQKGIRAIQNSVGTSRANVVNPQGGAPAGAPVQIQGDADYSRLPSGARFIGPDGRARIKP